MAVNRDNAPKIPLTEQATQYRLVPGAVALPDAQGMGATWFGPLTPPNPIAPPEVAGRELDYPAGYNLNLQPRAYSKISFEDLRGLADGFDLLRTVIETRKDQMERLKWGIKPKLGPDGKPVCKPTDPRIKKVQKFFEKPSSEHSWGTWLRMLLEDLLVIDAPSIWKKRTRGGQLFSLEPIDGGTIKRVIDDFGRTPQPPYPAYQQILKGLPAVNYTTKDLTYAPRNVRSHKIYGYSPVEQIIITVNIALRRQVFQLQYYTEGNVPEALIGTPDTWSPENIESFQKIWDSYFEGNTASRRHAKFVPGGVAKTFIPTKEPELKNVFDEWLARIVCFAFSIAPTAFIAQVNRATAQTAQQTAQEEGLAPLQLWVKHLIDAIIVEEYGYDDLEFAWADDQEVDPAQQSIVLTTYAKAGVMSINEVREAIGLDPVKDNPAAEQPMVLSGTGGYFPLDANLNSDGSTVYPDVKADDDAQRQKEVNASKPAPVVQAPGAAQGAGQKPAAKKPEPAPAEKMTKAASGKTHVHHGGLSHNRPTSMVAKVKIRGKVLKILRNVGKDVARQLHRVDKVAKAIEDTPEEKARKIAEALSLTGFEDLGELSDAIADITASSATETIAKIGVDTSSDIVDQVYDRAVKYAADNSATLVTQVEDATRNMLRFIIEDGLKENKGIGGIADDIEASGPFSEDRAALIANTEVGDANSQGSLMGLKEAKSKTGLHIMKEWLPDAEACDVCKDNGDQGPIELDDDFLSGDDAPLAHPRCECALGAVVEEDDEG